MNQHAVIYDRGRTQMQEDNWGRIDAKEVGIRIFACQSSVLVRACRANSVCQEKQRVSPALAFRTQFGNEKYEDKFDFNQEINYEKPLQNH
jgi:hypothetical protein